MVYLQQEDYPQVRFYTLLPGHSASKSLTVDAYFPVMESVVLNHVEHLVCPTSARLHPIQKGCASSLGGHQAHTIVGGLVYTILNLHLFSCFYSDCAKDVLLIMIFRTVFIRFWSWYFSARQLCRNGTVKTPKLTSIIWRLPLICLRKGHLHFII